MQPLLLLKTGDLPRRVVAHIGNYERAFLNILGDERFVVVDARREIPSTLNWSGILITGSPAGGYDSDPWIARSMDFLRRAAERATPMYGVCFGHQLLAQTFGGKVEKCQQGWELGTVSLALTDAAATDPLFSSVPRSFLGHESHGDVVIAPPPGATVLAQNAHCPYQAFVLNEHIWGTQFHPEFTSEIMTRMIEVLAPVLPIEAFPYRQSDSRPLADQLLATVRAAPAAQQCLENFVKIVEDKFQAS